MSNLLDLFNKQEDGSLIPQTNRSITCLIVGKSGSGKSCAAISFPGKTFIYNIDQRVRGIADSINWLGKEKLAEVDFETINLEDGFAKIDMLMSQQIKDAKDRRLKYRNICVESIGALCTLLAMDSRRLRGVKGARQTGSLVFLAPEDYAYASKAMKDIIYKFVLPMTDMGYNIFFSGWTVDRWGKPREQSGEIVEGMEYMDNIVIGEKLLAPDKLAEEIPGYFNDVYVFRKERDPRGHSYGAIYDVEFTGELARNTFGLPPGRHKITKSSFYELWKGMIDAKYSTSKQQS